MMSNVFVCFCLKKFVNKAENKKANPLVLAVQQKSNQV